LFCPTDSAVENLKKEGFDTFGSTIVKSGDVMYDGALFYKAFAQKPDIGKGNDFNLCTIHRAENTDNPRRLTSILEALNEIAKEKQIVLPIHPRTKKLLPSTTVFHPNITVIEPVGYLEMVWLLDNCNRVITDSGGLQKEAFFFKKPCITLRDETEWVELVENNFNVLVGADRETIVQAYKNHNFNENFDMNLYGKGAASEIVVRRLLG
jgi:UDP-GlcNAc3NAcA epimerase